MGTFRGEVGRIFAEHAITIYYNTAGSDYDSTTFTLEFTSSDEGTTTLCADVPITDDQLANEPVEAFSISFLSISPAGRQGLIRETCVFIVDNDSMCQSIFVVSTINFASLIKHFSTCGFVGRA